MTAPSPLRQLAEILVLAQRDAALIADPTPHRFATGDATGTLRPAPMPDDDADDCADESFATVQRKGEDAARASRKGDAMSDDERLARILALAHTGMHTTTDETTMLKLKCCYLALTRPLSSEIADLKRLHAFLEGC